MDVTKIIKATAVRGRTSTAASVIKEDHGLYLLIGGIDLPEVYEVDFSNEEHAGTSVTMIGNADGVLIPNQFIKSGKDIFAFYYHVGEDFGRTVYKFRIPNKPRPDRTDEEPTPEEQSLIDQAISALNTAVAKTAQDVISADQSARSASGDADRAERARTGAEIARGKAEEAQESAERAKDDAETSERNASESEWKAKGYAETASEKADSIHSMTASAQTLPAGSSASASYNAETGVMSFGIPKGKDGTDGEDGYSPTAYVRKSGKTATITITDKNGTTSAQVEDGEDGTDGIDGISPSVSVTDITGGHRVVITDKDGSKSFDVEDGATGATPNLTIGTVETLDPTDDATATITGTAENPVLNFGIPQGDAGEVTTEEFLKAFPTDTASGAIASFSDGADDLPLKSLVVDINPIQDLSHGDPSPENICPISGWTEVDVEQMGKNLFDADAFATMADLTKNEDGSLYVSFNGKVLKKVAWKNVGYTGQIAITYTYKYANANTGGALPLIYYTDGTYDFISTSSTTEWKTVTKISNASKIVDYVTFSYGTGSNSTTFFLQIELGSTATPYEPYSGQSLTIDLGQTVYGGHLDVLSGELTVYPYYASYNGETLTGEWISDRDKYVSGTTPTIGAQVVNIGAQGVTVQLEPHEVESLYGVNNLWADSGDTTAEYRADTKLFIERLTAPDSTDMVADANITSGKYFMVGNSLYKATANIANGSAIVVGTNCIRKSLSEALNEINA